MGKLLHRFMAPVMLGVAILWWCLAVPYLNLHPPAGIYIAILAFLVAIMSFWPPDNRWAKAAWVAVFGIVLVLEINTLYYEKGKQDQQQTDAIKKADNRFEKTISNLDRILVDQRTSYKGMLDELNVSRAEEQKRFSAILQREENLFTKQEALTKELFGRLDKTTTETLERAKLREGTLTPSNLPSPLTRCRIPRKAVAVHLGNNVGTVIDFPYTVLRIDGKDIITLNKTEDGFVISTDVYNDRGELVVRMNRNEFLVSPTAFYVDKRKSSLIIYDQKGDIALSIRISNPYAIKISGRYYTSEGTEVIINDKGVVALRKASAPMTLSGGCVETTGNGLVSFGPGQMISIGHLPELKERVP